MAKGKTTCRILKEIRRQIAEANDIEYVVEECQYKGDCKGTCPKCEAEVRYLEGQLHKRQMLGKAVVVAGLSLGVIPAMAQSAQVADSVVAQSSMCLLDTNIVVESKIEPHGKYIIQGKIIDVNKDKIIGASIIYKKEKKEQGTISNIDGNFALGIDFLPVKLIVSYPGYLDFEFDVTEENYKKFFQITLADDNTTLDNIVAGYAPYVKKVSKKAKKKQRKEK